MKKSKILVPALGILALGMSAAVTGTVAWFTTNKTVSAESLTAAIASAQDLRISDSLSPSYSWTNKLTWNVTDSAMIPATPIEGTVQATTAHYKDSATEYTNASTLAFIKPADGNEISADTGVATTAVNASGDNSASYELAGEHGYIHEDYALKYEGSITDKDGTVHEDVTVHGKVKVTANASRDIDQAVRIGILNATTSKLKIYELGTFNSGYSVTLDDLTLTNGQPQDFHVYIWYEGTDEACKNVNAITHSLSMSLTWSLYSIA